MFPTAVLALDSDGDGVDDTLDNCSAVVNVDQRDTDGDGFGNRCDPDLNNDNIVNTIDIVVFRRAFGTADPHADFNGDQIVNTVDIVLFKPYFGRAPGPGALVDDLPPDPAEIAPPLDPAAVTPLSAAVAFLYSGEDPIQTGVDVTRLDEQRTAVVRGRVLDRAGQPLGGVSVRIKDYSEYGQTFTRTDGQYDLVVNGGGSLVVDYQKHPPRCEHARAELTDRRTAAFKPRAKGAGARPVGSCKRPRGASALERICRALPLPGL
jgi:hypothetical protein